MVYLSSIFCAAVLAKLASAAPAAPSDASSVVVSSAVSSVVPSAVSSAVSSAEPVPSEASSAASPPDASFPPTPFPPEPTPPFISLDPNEPLFNPDTPGVAQPERGELGAPLLGPTDNELVKQNPDLLAPPSSDHGTVANAKWPFSLSHNRLQPGGWARNQNIQQMPLATAMAGVDMRLAAGSVRELHWHSTSEWAYVLKGSTQITSVDSQGRNYIATVNAGDLWYFPPGIPHSLQATNDDPEGSEFLLVFDNGAFSEDSTFLVTDWLSHVPAEVLSKNFQTNISAFAHIPSEELYIFPAELPGPDSSGPKSPQGSVPNPFSFPLSQVKATQLSGGTVKVVDSSTFKVSTTIAAAEVTVEPGAIRELHWHPTEDEWSFFLEGTGRVTIFASQSNARTFNYQAGDIGYVPATMGHYVENTGNTTLKYLEIFNSEKFEDVSLAQWLALTPPKLVQQHLGLPDDVIARLSKTKATVIGPS